jgi:DNA-binding PadR family transcriptional regulator
MHGYQILAELDRLFGDEYEPSTGTVYPAITALEDERLIASRKEGRRKTFFLAEAGRKALEQRADALAELELRTGKRLRSNGAIEAMLADFNARARALSKRLQPGNDERVAKSVERLLTRTMENLERIVGSKE